MLTYDKINIMLPTYKRAARLRRFLDSAFRTAADTEHLTVTLCVNEGDTETLEAVKEWYWPVPYQIVTENTDQPNLALYFNKMYDESRFRAPGTLLTMFGDDMIFRSDGWDAAWLDAMNRAEGRAIVYGDDDYIAGDRLCVHFGISELLVEATQRPFMCPLYPAEMIDVVWYDFGRMTGTLRYLPDVHIYHDHDGKRADSQWDETMQRLAPIRVSANGRNEAERAYQQQVAWTYAVTMAGNAVSRGVCKWA